MVRAKAPTMSLNYMILVTTVVVGLGACRAQEPARPEVVPATARWVGGEDGGAWVACDAGRHSSLQCNVYWESGSLAQRGTYAYRGMMLSQDDVILFDGETLYIEGSKRLVYQSSP